MDRFRDWWKRDKRYLTLVKAILLALLPVLCCLVHCAMQGRSIGEVCLPCSEWNDELFYYKQVEGIVNYGYPQGYFGFNESHALRLSFAAWSPVLVFPWIIWGLLFGWNMMSPVLCNIVLMTLACFLFVWLAKPGWKQLGVISLLFCLYTPFVRYMLSAMPEVICFSMLILFYGLAINYLKGEKGGKLALLFALSGLMTLMRPYLLLFLLLPAYLWTKKRGWKGLLGAGTVTAAVLAAYAAIKHYLGAEYFAPLFFTDWVDAFFEQGLLGGIRYTLVKLYYMGSSFMDHTVQGFRTGLASGAFFGGYLILLLVVLGQGMKDFAALRVLRGKRDSADVQGAGAGGRAGAGVQDRTYAQGADADAEGREGRVKTLKRQLTIEAHFAVSLVAMLFALLLMYKLTEGSKHLLTFMAAGVFIVGMMETRFYKKAVIIGAAFAYFFSYMALDPYDYQVPFDDGQRVAQVEEWRQALAGTLTLDTAEAPSYENSVIWLFRDQSQDGALGEGQEGWQENSPAEGQESTPREGQEGVPENAKVQYTNLKWQLLYALPEGFGISCCEREYVLEHFGELRSRYIAALAGGEVDGKCRMAGYAELHRDEDMVLYQVK